MSNAIIHPVVRFCVVELKIKESRRGSRRGSRRRRKSNRESGGEEKVEKKKIAKILLPSSDIQEIEGVSVIVEPH
jgi:hypothetical protein